MSKIIKLYHGSNCTVDHPELSRGRLDVDFGMGFYLTSDKTMAEKWACRRHPALINEYTIDLDGLNAYSFGLNEEWLKFVIQNRNLEQTDFVCKDFDVLIGCTADDKLFSTIEQYSGGYITKAIAIKALNCMEVGTQYVLKSEKAMQALHYEKTLEITPEKISEIKKLIRADRAEATSLTDKIIKEGIAEQNKLEQEYQFSDAIYSFINEMAEEEKVHIMFFNG